MIKLSVLLKKNRNLSIPDFHRYWINEHAEIAMRTPSWNTFIRKYVQTHTLHEVYSQEESSNVQSVNEGLHQEFNGESEGPMPSYDGVAQVWFDNLESYQKWSQLPELSVIAADEEILFERDKLGGLIATEHEIQAVPDWEKKSQIKALALIRKPEKMSAMEFHQYWLNHHGPLVRSRPWWEHCNRYVQSHIEYNAYPDGVVPYNYNGMAEFWFNDYDEYRKWRNALAQDEVVRADEAKFVGEAEFILTSEVKK